MTTTFHRTSISNHDLEVVHITDVAVGFLGYMLMNEVMATTIVNLDNDFAMFDVTNQFDGLWSINTSQGLLGDL
jgi:hypothetical protein